MDKQEFEGRATREVAAMLAEMGVNRSVSYDDLVTLTVTAWMGGYAAGHEDASAKALEAMRSIGQSS